MGTQNRDTAAAILEASRKEFMEYGYEKASLSMAILQERMRCLRR